MADNEIVEIENTDRFLYSRLVDLKVAHKDVATMIVNGVAQQTHKVSFVVMTCPNCGKILYSMPEGFSLVDVSKMLASGSEGLEGLINYCPDCGQKLRFKREIVSDDK